MPRLPKHHDPDFPFLKVQSEAKKISRKLNHLVQLHLAEALDLGNAITDFTDSADIGLCDPRRDVCDFLFQFLKDIAHKSEK